MTEQLFLPGMSPNPDWYFKRMQCGIVSTETGYDTHCFGGRECSNRSAFLAIYFKMGQYNEDDGRKDLVGFDCPFEKDSEQLYACGPVHLEELVGLVKEWGDVDPLPEIIVNASGIVQKDLHARIALFLQQEWVPDFFTAKRYSHGRESLESLWARERWRFI